jgi:hypothetical protein
MEDNNQKNQSYSYDFSKLTDPSVYQNNNEKNQSQETDDKVTKIEDLFGELNEAYGDPSPAVMSHDIDDVSPVTTSEVNKYNSEPVVSNSEIPPVSPFPTSTTSVDKLEDTQKIDSLQIKQQWLAAKEQMIESGLVDNNTSNANSLNNEQVQNATKSMGGRQKSLSLPGFKNMEFSNGNLTKTFLDCVVLCGITAAMGAGMLMFIINHI